MTVTLPYVLTVGQVTPEFVRCLTVTTGVPEDRNRVSQDVLYESNVRMGVACVLTRINMALTWRQFSVQAMPLSVVRRVDGASDGGICRARASRRRLLKGETNNGEPQTRPDRTPEAA